MEEEGASRGALPLGGRQRGQRKPRAKPPLPLDGPSVQGGGRRPGMGRGSRLEGRVPGTVVCCACHPATLRREAAGGRRGGSVSGRGGESRAWGEWHMLLLGFVPILFCFSKNLFRIILGPHSSSGRNRIVKCVHSFRLPPRGNHTVRLWAAICIYSPTAVAAAARDKMWIKSLSVSLALGGVHFTPEVGTNPAGPQQVGDPGGPGVWAVPETRHHDVASSSLFWKIPSCSTSDSGLLPLATGSGPLSWARVEP